MELLKLPRMAAPVALCVCLAVSGCAAVLGSGDLDSPSALSVNRGGAATVAYAAALDFCEAKESLDQKNSGESAALEGAEADAAADDLQEPAEEAAESDEPSSDIAEASPVPEDVQGGDEALSDGNAEEDTASGAASVSDGVETQDRSDASDVSGSEDDTDASTGADLSDDTDSSGASDEADASADSQASDTAAQLVEYAKQFLGCAYVYATAGPTTFDCSGFTSYVFAHFGYSLNRTAAGQYSNGVEIELDESKMQAGDLLLWRAYGSSSDATHAGIYIGNGQYIHASSTDGCVVISSLSPASTQRYLVGVRRIIG